MLKTTALSLVLSSTVAATASAGQRDVRTAIAQTRYVYTTQVELLEQSGNPTNPPYATASTQALAAEVKGCGIDYTGPSCLDTGFENVGRDGIQSAETPDKSAWILFSRFKKTGDSRVLLMAVIAEKDDKKIAFRTGSVYALRVGRTEVSSYKSDFAACQAKPETCTMVPLIAYDSVNEGKVVDQAMLDLQSSNDPRKFYHAANIAQGSQRTRTAQAALKAVLAERSTVITRSTNVTYQTAYMVFLKNSFANDVAFVSAIIRDQMNSAKDGSDMQLAAAYNLASLNQADAKVFTIVRKALKHPNPEARRGAVIALATISSTTQDENSVLELLGDADATVRKAAVDAAADLNLDNDNLATLAKLSQNRASNVRGNAAIVLARIETPEALAKLGALVSDADRNVRATVFNALDKRTTYSDQDVAILLPLFVDADATGKSILASIATKAAAVYGPEAVTSSVSRLAIDSRVKVRRDAALLLGQLATDTATNLLVQMLGDANLDVRTAAAASLDKKILTDSHIDTLYQVANHADGNVRMKAVAYLGKIKTKRAVQALAFKATDQQFWQVRRDVATILGGYVGTEADAEATSAVISLIADSIKEVRDAAMLVINQGRILDDTQVNQANLYRSVQDPEAIRNVIQVIGMVQTPFAVQSLTYFVMDARADVRLYAVQVLGSNLSIDATSALIQFMADVDPTVKATVASYLGTGRSFVDTNIEWLGQMLNNSASDVRQLSARYLGTTSSQRALDLLNARLSVEMDAIVAGEIRAAISAINSRPIE